MRCWASIAITITIGRRSRLAPEKVNLPRHLPETEAMITNTMPSVAVAVAMVVVVVVIPALKYDREAQTKSKLQGGDLYLLGAPVVWEPAT